MGTDQYKTVFVGRLNYETTDETLRKAFDGIVGEVLHVHIVKDIKTGKSRGYGFVEFSDDREADRKHSKFNFSNSNFLSLTTTMSYVTCLLNISIPKYRRC